jgi:hypothetical protein
MGDTLGRRSGIYGEYEFPKERLEREKSGSEIVWLILCLDPENEWNRRNHPNAPIGLEVVGNVDDILAASREACTRVKSGKDWYSAFLYELGFPDDEQFQEIVKIAQISAVQAD